MNIAQSERLVPKNAWWGKAAARLKYQATHHNLSASLNNLDSEHK